ncbi:MAG: hypothetical protein LIP23_02360 [Planctomycetes bacterium]|nr:hypothetical protein [Planctomycetota bacterium]
MTTAIDPMVSTTRLRALRSSLGTGDKPLILAIHDYPDPDAIAAAMAFQTLAGSWGINSVIAYGGGIGREENAEMIRLLKIEMRTFASLEDLTDYRGALFLDTQPLAKNQSLPLEVPVLGVIDHHRLSDESPGFPSQRRSTGTTKVIYSDVRLSVGASSTLAFGYLETAGITPDERLATALFLGIKTDTDGLLRDANPADIGVYTRLMALSDLKLASQVIHPPLDRDYFRFLHMAVAKAVVYGTALISDCGDVETPDMLSTASDMLIGLRGVDYSLAVGFNSGKAYLSLRAKPPQVDATRVLLDIVGSGGKGGGHGLSAGGVMADGRHREACLRGIRDRFLESTGTDTYQGTSLI